MFWFGVAPFVVAWVAALLVWACCAVAKEGDDAFEELNESIRKLHQVAQSVARTSGRSAELVGRRSEPIRHLLAGMEDDVAQPQRRSQCSTGVKPARSVDDCARCLAALHLPCAVSIKS